MLKNNKQQQFSAPSGRVFIFWLILIAIIILAAVGIYYALLQVQKMQSVAVDQSGQVKSLSGSPATATSTSSADPLRRLAEKAGRPALGNPAAGLVIVEFADFECSVCQEEFYQIREFINRHQNEVYYIYRHHPIKGNNSTYLAKASMCAYEQDKFWPLHDKLFLNQGRIESEAAVSDLVRQSGVEVVRFEQCMKADRYRTLIFEDMTDAVNLGVQGTPTFFVNGSKLESAIKLADWERILSKYKEVTNK